MRVYRNVLDVRVPAEALPELVAFEEIDRLERLPGTVQKDDTLSTEYLCAGLPARYDSAIDTDTNCAPPASGVVPFLDGSNAATGIFACLDAGYNGDLTVRGTQGLAGWAHDTSHYHLAIGVSDHDSFYSNHWAFRTNLGGTRVYYFVNADGTVYADGLSAEANSPGYLGNHGTMSAAIALGDITGGQDANVPGWSDRYARRGVARGAVAVFSAQANISRDLDLWATDFGEGPDGPAGGVDVVSCSITSNSGEEIDVRDGADVEQCATADEARGLDTDSTLVVEAYFDGVVFCKSVGNKGGVWLGAECESRGDANSEVAAPGASPAAISVGGLANDESTPKEMQDSEELYTYSSRGTTSDGRTYPLLVVPHRHCGVPQGSVGYGRHSATSAATPRVAGSAVLLKHWLLETYGNTIGNSPGWVISNLLNFADEGHYVGENDNPYA